jgi:hypothetical protein
MIIKSEDQILDPAVRKRIIQDIEGQENRSRKNEMYKRYQCYKDRTDVYVLALLLRQFDRDTVEEMRYALSNLGISRKVVDKLARVYKYGVERDLYIAGKEQEDETLIEAARLLKVDQTLKKTNRFFKLFKNTALYIRPMDGTIKLSPLAPYLYDVIEYEDNREKAMCYVLSNYSPTTGGGITQGLAVLPGTDGRAGQTVGSNTFGDGIDQTIADRPEDENLGKYTWWSDSYHFVTNSKGAIVAGPEDARNPIEEMPFVNYAEDQDGSFWAQGGNDLTDGAILINSMITNINHIGIVQGYGQLVMTGKDLPKQVKVGPNKAIRLTHEGEDPVPTFRFESANPPLDQLRALVEMYVALLLTTNNLSTSGVASNLSGSQAFPSGIAMLIDKAESMEDVEDQRQVFQDNEPLVWRKVAKWHTLLKSRDELSSELKALTFPDDFDVKATFGDPKPIETERERLETLRLKKELGIISALDLIKQEYPQLTDEQAEEKLAEILEENMKRVAATIGGQGNESNQGNDRRQPNYGDNRPRNTATGFDETGDR